ncbi:MAG TPA: hypothetical protein VI365_19970, partial [Trebonia sp.]
VPAEQRCIWPGCTRRRAAGRASGSGRQPEYCEKADRPGAGGGHEHNARNRWALRNQELRDKGLGGTGVRESREAGLDEPRQGPGPRREPAADGSGGGAGAVRDPMPLTYAKLHASELLDQARRQHAGALAALAAERETYARLGEQLQALADPAALDLEIAAVTLRAGREIAQAAEDAARARQAQLAAEQARDQAIAGRRDAERVLAERTAELEQERDVLIRDALAAALRADQAQEQAAEARAAAAESRQASEEDKRAAEVAKAEAARQVTEASARADAAAVRADEAVRAAQGRADAERERADADAERATRQVAAAQDDAQAARRDGAEARAEARELRSRLTAASAGLTAARAEAEAARVRAADQQARQNADITRLAAVSDQLREDADRQRADRDRDLARLEAAHREAIEAERARTRRAEGEHDALRAGQPPAALPPLAGRQEAGSPAPLTAFERDLGLPSRHR